MARTPLLLAVTLVAAVGCHATGTWATGPAAAPLKHPPYYATLVGGANTVVPQAQLRIGYYAAGFQKDRLPAFGPKTGEGSAVAELLAAMNGYLTALADSMQLASLGAARSGNPYIPPDVQFGCERGDDDCAYDGNGIMRLTMNLPSRQWVAASAATMDSATASYAILITLELGNYWLAQNNWRGGKAVELGTDHIMPVPWLTDLKTPVSVIQLTGALIGPDGRALRLGAEGILARRTEFMLSAMIPGAQRNISDGDVRAAIARRRDDLPGNPLAWQVALRTLVTQLTAVMPGR